VPERRAELTTEGGLDVAGQSGALQPVVDALRDAGVRVSLFIDAEPRQIEAARALGAPVVELHTGAYCEAAIKGDDHARDAELERLREGARMAASAGLEVHAGHGLTFDTVAPIAEMPEIVELNIGHFLIGEAIFSGLDSAVRRMRALMQKARAGATGSLSA
jgi:pyridoxine 5-phosphate synthase